MGGAAMGTDGLEQEGSFPGAWRRTSLGFQSCALKYFFYRIPNNSSMLLHHILRHEFMNRQRQALLFLEKPNL